MVVVVGFLRAQTQLNDTVSILHSFHCLLEMIHAPSLVRMVSAAAAAAAAAAVVDDGNDGSPYFDVVAVAADHYYYYQKGDTSL